MRGEEALDELIDAVLEHGEREALLEAAESGAGLKQPGQSAD